MIKTAYLAGFSSHSSTFGSKSRLVIKKFWCVSLCTPSRLRTAGHLINIRAAQISLYRRHTPTVRWSVYRPTVRANVPAELSQAISIEKSAGFVCDRENCAGGLCKSIQIQQSSLYYVLELKIQHRARICKHSPAPVIPAVITSTIHLRVGFPVFHSPLPTHRQRIVGDPWICTEYAIHHPLVTWCRRTLSCSDASMVAFKCIQRHSNEFQTLSV